MFDNKVKNMKSRKRNNSIYIQNFPFIILLEFFTLFYHGFLNKNYKFARFLIIQAASTKFIERSISLNIRRMFVVGNGPGISYRKCSIKMKSDRNAVGYSKSKTLYILNRRSNASPNVKSLGT